MSLVKYLPCNAQNMECSIRAASGKNQSFRAAWGKCADGCAHGPKLRLAQGAKSSETCRAHARSALSSDKPCIYRVGHPFLHPRGGFTSKLNLGGPILI